MRGVALAIERLKRDGLAQLDHLLWYGDQLHFLIFIR